MTNPMQTAIAELQAAIKLHTGHMDGSVPDNAATEQVEMAHLQAALKALQAMTASPGMTPDQMAGRMYDGGMK